MAEEPCILVGWGRGTPFLKIVFGGFSMKKKLTTVVFRGTPEQEEKLIAAIDKYKGVKGAMMPILQEAQSIYGYLPIEVQKIIAERTGVSLEEIYGIASFYAQFKLNPVRLAMDKASFPVAAKDMAAIRGLEVGDPYLPSLPTTNEATLEHFKKVMKEAGLI